MHVEALWQSTFSVVRSICEFSDLRHVVLVRPSQDLLCLVCPLPGTVAADKTAQVESIVPPNVKRRIAILSSTIFSPEGAEITHASGRPDLMAASRAIPFFGMVLGFAYIGHAVWVFDGQRGSLEAGITGADLLIVDSAVANKFTTKTLETAGRLMRNANVLAHDRSTFSLKVLRKVGASGALEFPS